MNYHLLKVEVDKSLTEILMAFLGQLPFDSFEETDFGLNAYIVSESFTDDLKQALGTLQEQFTFTYTAEKVVPQNWNALWEASFQPIKVDDFCGIRADFHAPLENVQHELVINPKMAFGTGHHETTYMMIQLMRDLDFDGKYVFDFGCGTGVLAILAAKLEAKTIEAVDIELPSYMNTIENASINEVSNINAVHGALDAIQQTDFDIILANINRNVILESLATLYNKLKTNGILLISGVLIEDQQKVKEAGVQNGFKIGQSLEKGEWSCFELSK